MTTTPGKAPKKEKEKRQTPEERLEALRYNHMMYGLTEGEQRLKPKVVDYGASYLKHPKFQALVTAFRNGSPFNFDVTADGRAFSISTEGTHIAFDGKVICYSRSLNHYEDNLLLDRAGCIQLQTTEAAVHLIFAVLRSFPEFGKPVMTYMRHKIYYGPETLEAGSADLASNILIGSFKHTKVQERAKKK